MVSYFIFATALVGELLLAGGLAEDSKSGASKAPAHALVADSACRDRVNKMIALKKGDQVEIQRRVEPSHPDAKKVPPESALGRKVYITYVRVLTGSHSSEYCWVPSVDIR